MEFGPWNRHRINGDIREIGFRRRGGGKLKKNVV